MNRIYRRCHSCRESDVSVAYRRDVHAVVCAECHVDALRAVREDATPERDTFVNYSPAALLALASSC